MYYIFKNNFCIGAYSYLPQLEKDEQAIQSEVNYSSLGKLRLKAGVITVIELPPEPPKMIEAEKMPTEQVELYDAIAGIYELLEGDKK